MDGSALKGTMTGGALPVELEAEIDSPSGNGELIRLVEDAIRRSPVHGLIKDVLRSQFTLTHNGHEIEFGEGEAHRWPS